MKRMILKARVGANGVLQVPLGEAAANREVCITIEPTSPPELDAQQDYLNFLQATAGAWQGDFERPEQGDYEVRDPLP
jgi:hypothetical protein